MVKKVSLLLMIAVFVIQPAIGQALHAQAEQWAECASGDYTIIPNITYSTANNLDLKLDLYVPNNHQTPHPLLMLFHGGGWVAGAKERNVMQFLPYLAMGWTVVNVEYRMAKNSPAPAAVEDCRCALRWVEGHAAAYKYDVSKIVLTGGSAGGHLALITGMLPANSVFDRQCPTDDSIRWKSGAEPAVHVAAIVNWYGITDVAELLDGPNAKHYAIEWFGSMSNRKELAEQVSPLTYVRAGLPPIITIHGDRDDVVPYTQAVRLHAALQKVGVTNRLMTIPGAGHGGFDRQALINGFDAIRKFLHENGIQ